MIIPILAAAAVASAPAAVKVTLPQASCRGVDPAVCANVSEYVATRLTRPELALTTSADVVQMLGIETQKQLLGCPEDAPSCLAEMAGALGSEVILTTSLSKAEGRLFLNLRAISGGAKTLASRSLRGDGLRDLEAAMDREVPGLADEVITAIRPALLVKPRWFLVPAGTAAASAIAGGVLVAFAAANASQLEAWQQTRAPSLDAVDETARKGAAQQKGAYVLFGVATVAAVASVFVYRAELEPPAPHKPAVGLLPTADGAVLALSGALP